MLRLESFHLLSFPFFFPNCQNVLLEVQVIYVPVWSFSQSARSNVKEANSSLPFLLVLPSLFFPLFRGEGFCFFFLWRALGSGGVLLGLFFFFFCVLKVFGWGVFFCWGFFGVGFFFCWSFGFLFGGGGVVVWCFFVLVWWGFFFVCGFGGGFFFFCVRGFCFPVHSTSNTIFVLIAFRS